MLGIEYPIFQGGMAWIADADLAAAVSNAGGLGIIAAGNADTEYVRGQVRKAKEMTSKPFGLNIMLLSPFADEIAQMVVDEGVKVVTTGAGNAGKYMSLWKEADVKVIPVVPSVTFAKMAARTGAFAVIAEGGESGGHIGELATMPLVPQVCDAIDLPVIAAGGIADGRGIAAALALGAEAVQLGTRFLSAKECNIHENYRNKVFKAGDTATVVTGRRLGHPVRSIKNQFAREYGKIEYTDISDEELDQFAAGRLRMAATPYYLSLINLEDVHDPIRKQALPTANELYFAPYEDNDPLAEDEYSPCPGLTHRYPDRVLLLVTDQCAMYCRHCTRRRFTGQNDTNVPKEQVVQCIEYIRNHSEIRDVLVSGGDPLSIAHVEVIRFGSRIPVVCPQRITPSLCAMLKKYHPIWFNVQFNHPDELTPEAVKACAMMADAGIPVGNQSVLLAGINDCVYVMKELMNALVRARIRPYYIYNCDPSLGLSHFRTPISKGIEIMEALRGHTSGFCVPTFVVDAPGGGGKIPIMPTYLITCLICFILSCLKYFVDRELNLIIFYDNLTSFSCSRIDYEGGF